MYPLPSDETGYAVYIHVPFCRKRCPYCDFYLRTDAYRRLSPYLEYVPFEWRQRLQHPSFISRKPLTLYFGGGTPSILSPETIATWISEWRAIGLPESAEITLEANPEDAGNFPAFRDAGINRLSLGFQSFHDDELKLLGRAHTRADNMKAYDAARTSQFDSISFDLIYALPFGSEEAWILTLEEAIALQPDHLSCYALTVEAGTSYWQRWKRGEFSLPTEEDVAQQLQTTFDLLEPAGYSRYELSNFCQPGHESKHNLAYWIGTPYLACGPSAHGYDGMGRYANIADVNGWQQKLSAGIAPDNGWEILTTEQHRIETIAMQLRLNQGLELNQPELKIDRKKIHELESQGWGVISSDHFQLTSAGLVREAAITRYLL